MTDRRCVLSTHELSPMNPVCSVGTRTRLDFETTLHYIYVCLVGARDLRHFASAIVNPPIADAWKKIGSRCTVGWALSPWRWVATNRTPGTSLPDEVRPAVHRVRFRRGVGRNPSPWRWAPTGPAPVTSRCKGRWSSSGMFFAGVRLVASHRYGDGPLPVQHRVLLCM